MADAKLSSFPVAVSIANIDYIPLLQNGANKLATAAQIKAFNNAATVSSVVAAAIPLANSITGVSGVCTLPDAASAVKIILIAEGTGTISFTGGSYSFATGNTLELVWFADKWNVLANQGMI